MNPAHIESVLLKELAARRRKFWTVPVKLALLPAMLVAFLSVVGALVNAVGIPLHGIPVLGTIHYLPINFHRLDAIAGVSGSAFNIALQIVVVVYLCRSLHDREGRDEALFWKGIGLTPGEVITVRVLLCTVVLPLLAAVLTALVPTSLGLVDLIGQFVTGGPALASAASLLVETPTLVLLVFTAFIAQALWLFPFYSYLLVVSGASKGRGHPVGFALLGGIALMIVGDFVPPLGYWLSLLVREDPFTSVLRFKPHEVHIPLLFFNTALGLVLLPLATRLYARLEH
ncbi:MAG: hypothetical protein M1574_00680 [Gammaproteobacteria bacterium]|nr:hypothetical protein [Gammaproteobacteria bacterium]